MVRQFFIASDRWKKDKQKIKREKVPVCTVSTWLLKSFKVLSSSYHKEAKSRVSRDIYRTSVLWFHCLQISKIVELQSTHYRHTLIVVTSRNKDFVVVGRPKKEGEESQKGSKEPCNHQHSCSIVVSENIRQRDWIGILAIGSTGANGDRKWH